MRECIDVFAMQKALWTSEETKTLSDNWMEHNQRELHEKFLPNKTVTQIRNKKMDMGFKKGPKWSEEEIEILFKYGPYHTSEQLSKTVLRNKTKNQIHDRRSYYEIRRRLNN